MHSAIRLGMLSVLAACQPDPPPIQAKPEPPPEPADTDEAIPLAQPDIEVEPMALSFGGWPVACPSTAESFTIRNVGNRPLDISTLEVRGQQASQYTITSNIPARLRSGEEVTLDVTFEADNVNVTYDLARVFIASNDPDEAEVRVDLTGDGALARYEEEVFLQQQASGVDVLWVLDNSGSMEEDVTRLENALDTFVQSMVNLGLDYRLAVTTTDADGSGSIGTAGEFVGPWVDGAILTQQEVIQRFTGQVQQVASGIASGDFGSATERGFTATQLALAAQPPPNNTGFLRQDATLAVAVLSDEDDASSIAPNAFSTWLAGLKGGDMDKVSFSGITISGASDYRTAVNLTGGVWTGITTADITPFLTFLSFVAAGLEITFELDETPLATTGQAITVQVCDAQGTCTDISPSAVDGWSWNSSTNSIEMNGSAIPEPGESVVVTYPVETDCPT